MKLIIASNNDGKIREYREILEPFGFQVFSQGEENIHPEVEETGASFEDARSAIRACDGDMLDAMVYLEKLGKISTNKAAYADPRFAPISEAEMACAAAKRAERRAVRRERCEKHRGAIGRFVRKAINFLVHNKIAVSKDGNEIACLPLFIVLIICNASLGFAFAAMIVSMFFGFEYSFRGETDFNIVNRARYGVKAQKSQKTPSIGRGFRRFAAN